MTVSHSPAFLCDTDFQKAYSNASWTSCSATHHLVVYFTMENLPQLPHVRPKRNTSLWATVAERKRRGRSRGDGGGSYMCRAAAQQNNLDCRSLPLLALLL